MPLLRIRLLIAVAVALTPPLAFAQTPAAGEFRVNTFTPADQTRAAATADAAGRFVVIWQSSGQDGSGQAVVGQRLDASGAPLGGEFVVNQYTTGDQATPSVATVPDGRFLVAWASAGQDGSGSGVFGRFYNASGTPAGPEFAVNVTTIGSQGVPSVAAIPGGFVVVWQGDAYQGFGRVYTAAGNPTSSEFRISAYTTDRQLEPQAAGLPNGAFVLAWRSIVASLDHVYVRVYDTGGPLGPEARVDTPTSSNSLQIRTSLSLASHPDGAFTVAWKYVDCFVGDGIVCTNDAVQAREYSADGTPVGLPFFVASEALAQDPAVTAANLRGLELAAWTANGRLSCNPPFFCDPVPFPDGSGGAVFARRISDTLPNAPFRVNTFTAGDQLLPAVATDPVGNALVVWQSQGQDGSGWGVYGQRFGGLRPAALDVDTGGNHVLEAGETVDVRPSWRNLSGAPVTPGGTFSAFSGPAGAVYSITDGSTAYATAAAGGTSACTDCYEVAVTSPSTRPATHWDATVAETLTPDNQGQRQSWSLHLGGSFTDVPASNAFYRFVETLLHRGVTAGCNATSYCPGDPTTRAALAVFVLTAKEGAGYAPPSCVPPNIFGDVPETSGFCRYVEELANRGVVNGCGGGNYCPNDPVTREQMAVFVLRTLDPALSPPDCTTPRFTDVPATSPFCRWVEELANRGVVAGCGGGSYCPTAPVTREQMAVFVSATFGLTLYGP